MPVSHDFAVSRETPSNGASVIWERLARDVLPLLEGELARRFRGIDEQLIHDGASDAIVHHCKHPHIFDASRGVPLVRFLARAAWRRVNKLQRTEQRLKRREKRVAFKNIEIDVAHDPSAGYLLQEESEQLDQRVKAILDVLKDPWDRVFLALRMRGTRDRRTFAAVLDIIQLSIEQQRREVKRRKDRIRRYLVRKGFARPLP